MGKLNAAAAAAMWAWAAGSASAANVTVNQTVDIRPLDPYSGQCFFCRDSGAQVGGPIGVGVAVGDTLTMTYDFLGDQQLTIVPGFLAEVFVGIANNPGTPGEETAMTGALSFLGLDGSALFTTPVESQSGWAATPVELFGSAGIFHQLDSLPRPFTFAGLSWTGTIDAYEPGVTTRHFNQSYMEVWATTTSVIPGGAPEPSAWALMLLGLGAAGAALRSRRRAPI